MPNISPYLGKVATNSATGDTVRVEYDNHSGGVHVMFLSGFLKGHRTWFRVTDLENYRVA